ncbi:amino acid permease [Rothia terrae]|uniref:amino acid permease n=1 Tax=Rothia terrae TaxID=396015 RepID=UPI0014485A06|nr:amino acid permease [Rothia terrae]NKZ34528.1 amino acid permease [Rothia terrae]
MASHSAGSDIEQVNTTADDSKLQRGLANRHLQMIAIGGAIGTGLFVASGSSIATAGPGGALLAYGLIGIMVLLLMQSLGEMAAHLPIAGSFQAYASRYVSPSFGFAMGWNYWFNWAITLAAELVAAGIIMAYWFPSVPGWIWAAVFLVALTGLNAVSARAYGEGEFWLATIKVVTVIVFLIAGIAMIFGIFGGHTGGLKYWTEGDAPFVGGWLSVVSIFMVAGFSFQGTEMIGTAAGEAENPRRDVPKAIKTVFWRIMLFYVGAIFIIGTLVVYTDPNLLRSDATDIAYSPFTMVFERAGLAFAAGLMNTVILTAILSAGNSGLYVSSRMLYGLAKEGQAPKIFTRVNSGGVPVPALLMTAAVGMVGFITAIVGQGTAYTWLINISGLSGFIVWVGVALCHFRFRRAYVKQGHDLKALPYRAPLFPVGPILAFVMCSIVILGQNYEAVFAGRGMEVLSAYIGLPVFIAVWLIHKAVTKSKTVPLETMDVSGLDVQQR